MRFSIHDIPRLLLLASALACGDDEPGPADAGAPDAQSPDAGEPETLEIEGVWASNFGTEEIITAERFDGAPIRFLDPEANVLVTQNPPDAEFFPDAFNRVVWTEPAGDVFYYCFVEFGLDTLAEARDSTATADASDPDNSGCGGFAWTRLRRAIALRGVYESNFGGLETITATVWTQYGTPFGLVDWADDARWAVTRSPDDAEFEPGTFNRLEMTPQETDGSFYYCTVDFALPTAEAARTSTNTADPSDPETTGCGAFPWTRLDPR